MKDEIRCALCELMGKERISVDKLDLLCYARDLASSMPDELLKGYGMLGPDVIVSPRDIQGVSDVLKFAYEHDIPITPRGAGSTALGGVLPMEGGIVLDLCGINRIEELNEEDEYVRVGTGAVWKRLVDYLERRGFQPGANPSSGPSATIGGYIAAGGGAGIGVSKYGVVGDQILSMKVVLADGRIVETGPRDSWVFAGSEGTLGVICEVTLKIFPQRERRHFLFGFDTLFAGVEALGKLARLKPYQLSFLDEGMVRFLNLSGAHFARKAMTIGVMIDGAAAEVEANQEKVLEICASGYRYPERDAEEEWKHRYKVGLMFKSLGPSLFVQEIRVPIRSLQAVLEELAEMLEQESWGVESLASDSETVALVISMLGDERKSVEYLNKFSLVNKIADLAFRHDGCVFGIGLHNSGHMPKLHGNGLEIMRKIRRTLDPKNILNPSKTTQIRLPAFMTNLSMKMMGIAPYLVRFGLETGKYMPQKLMRFGLKVVGANLR